jgi:hypothetical protein
LIGFEAPGFDSITTRSDAGNDGGGSTASPDGANPTSTADFLLVPLDGTELEAQLLPCGVRSHAACDQAGDARRRVCIEFSKKVSVDASAMEYSFIHERTVATRITHAP